MPTTITTSTAATATAYSNQRKVDRTSNGVLWHWSYGGSAISGAYSIDNGATWTAGGGLNPFAGTGTSYTPNFSVFIDVDDYVHLVYKDRHDGYIYYRRGTPNAARTAWTWSAAYSAQANISMDYPDIVAHREGTGWKVHTVCSYVSGTNNLVYYARINVSSAGALTTETASFQSISGNYGVSVHLWPSIDFNHTGDGKTVAGGTPHLYVGWSAGATGAGKGIRSKKIAYSAGSWTTGTGGTEYEIDANRKITDARWGAVMMFDGTRPIYAGSLMDSASAVDHIIYDLSASTGALVTSRWLNDVVTGERLDRPSATYDSNGNVYIIGASQASPYPVQYRRWVRATNTFDAKVVVDADSSSAPMMSMKRGYSDGRIEWVYTDGTASPYSVTYDGISLNAPPNAPVLVAPTNGATIDLSKATLFDWTFSDPDAGDTQGAWAFRRKLSGAASYEYWNAGTTAWQSTEVWNSGSTTEYTFAAGTWTNGNTYNWSVATKDAAGLAGPYAGDWTITGGQPPSVTVDAPTGTVVITRPNVQWTFSDPAGGTQVSYHLKVYDSVQYSAAGFDPNTSTAVHDTGEVNDSSARIRTIQADLQTGTTYRAYMRVKDNEGIYSQWAYSQFTVQLSPPNTPSIVVTDDPTNARVIIDVQGHDNLLTENQASLETDATGWYDNGNATLTRSTAQAADGVASLSMAATTAGGMSIFTGPLPGVPAIAGLTYTAYVEVRAATTGRTFQLDLSWRDAGGASIGTSVVTTGTDTTAGWTALRGTVTAPTNAANVLIVLRETDAATAAGEVHYVDKAGIFPGSVTTWARGGLAASTAFIVERSMDGGITWEPVRGTETGQVHDGAPTQKLRVLDREIGPGTQPTYRAKTTVEV